MEDLQSIVARIDHIVTPASHPAAGEPDGLISGDLTQPIARVLFATELTPEATAEAIGAGADLLVTLLDPGPVTLVGRAGELLRRLVGADVALFSAERAGQGLAAEAISTTIDLQDPSPLVPFATGEYAMLVVYTPEENAEEIRRGLAHAGAGAIGDYSGCAWSVTGTGEFTPEAGAEPTIGRVGAHERVRERRLEMVVPIGRIPRVTQALRRVHPYEEPAFSFVATHAAPGRHGRGRVGDLAQPCAVAELGEQLAHELADGGIRYYGGEQEVGRAAVCSRVDQRVLSAAVTAGAGVLISADFTSDLLRHADSHGLGLIDVPRHTLLWAALPALARKVAHATGGEIDTIVSTARGPQWRSG